MSAHKPDPFIVDIFEAANALEHEALFQPTPGVHKEIAELRQLGADLIAEDAKRSERMTLEDELLDRLLSTARARAASGRVPV